MFDGLAQSRNRLYLRRTFQRRRHLVARRAVENRELYLLAERPPKRRIISTLVESACDQNYRRRQRVDRLDHRADVGPFRIVDISHAAVLVDDFNSMRQPAK